MSNESRPNTSIESSWWLRTCGGRDVLRVAMPLVVTSFSWTIMTFMDRMFLRWQSNTAMSASFSAAVLWFAVLCLPLGICAYASTFVSQYHGNGQPKQIGPATWQGAWVALLSTPLMLAVAPLAPIIFQLAGHGTEATQQEILYFQILCVGGPALLMSAALSSFFSGRGKTWVIMCVDTLFSLVNLVLDYLWIFGYGGFPEMGIAGAGWATVVALWLKAFTYALLVLRSDNRLQFHTLSGMRFNRPLFNRLIYYGGPSGVQMLLDVMGFTVFVLLVGRMGDLQREATTMAFSISTLAFMPMWGFGLTASIMVGQRLGENRDDLAARATWTSLRIGMTYIVFISALFVLAPEMFLYGFFAGAELPAVEQSALHTMAVNLLRFVAAYNMLDAMLMIFVCAIKGAGDTRFVLWVSLVMAAMLAGLSWLAVIELKLNIYQCWAIVTGWIWVLGVIYLKRFLGGKWRDMRVIDLNDEEKQSEDDLESAIGMAIPVESI